MGKALYYRLNMSGKYKGLKSLLTKKKYEVCIFKQCQCMRQSILLVQNVLNHAKKLSFALELSRNCTVFIVVAHKLGDFENHINVSLLQAWTTRRGGTRIDWVRPIANISVMFKMLQIIYDNKKIRKLNAESRSDIQGITLYVTV